MRSSIGKWARTSMSPSVERQKSLWLLFVIVSFVYYPNHSASNGLYRDRQVIHVEFTTFLRNFVNRTVRGGKIIDFQLADNLFMDAEGAEYEMLPLFLNDGLEKNGIVICMLNVEVFFQSLNTFSDPQAKRGTEELVRRLDSAVAGRARVDSFEDSARPSYASLRTQLRQRRLLQEIRRTVQPLSFLCRA